MQEKWCWQFGCAREKPENVCIYRGKCSISTVWYDTQFRQPLGVLECMDKGGLQYSALNGGENHQIFGEHKDAAPC